MFDGNHEFDIIFVEKCNNKKQELEEYAQTGSYLAISLFLLHFSTKIISNSQSPSKVASTDI
jgi:hypothetical protein